MKIRARFNDGKVRDFEAINYKLDDDILTVDGNSYDGVVEAFELIQVDDLFNIVDELLYIKDKALRDGGYNKETFDREEQLLLRYYKIRGVA